MFILVSALFFPFLAYVQGYCYSEDLKFNLTFVKDQEELRICAFLYANEFCYGDKYNVFDKHDVIDIDEKHDHHTAKSGLLFKGCIFDGYSETNYRGIRVFKDTPGALSFNGMSLKSIKCICKDGPVSSTIQLSVEESIFFEVGMLLWLLGITLALVASVSVHFFKDEILLAFNLTPTTFTNPNSS